MAANRRKITIKTVAEEAGVSPATVSLILAERPGWVDQFHPETIKKVRSAAARLGYRRNIFASTMPSGESVFFALVLHETQGGRTERWRHWSFEGALLEGVNAGAEGRGVHPILVTTRAEPDETDATKVALIIEGGVFGSIVRTPGPELEDVLWSSLQNGHPMVVVFPRQFSDWPSNAIDIDNTLVGRTAGRLLAGRKRRHWALVRYRQMTEAHRLRGQGVTKLARSSGVRLTTVRLPAGVDENQAARLVARELERSHIDGLFAVDSVASVGSVLGCMRAGLMPGIDCDLVGCDASLWRTPGLPRITTVDISWRDVGLTAIDRLLRIAHAANPAFKSVLLKPRVVEGDSCPVPARFRPEPHEDQATPPDLQLRPGV